MSIFIYLWIFIIYMKRKTLHEEIERIKDLFVFEQGQLPKDLLTEAESAPFDKPIVTDVTLKENNSGTIRMFGAFPVNMTKNSVASEFVKIIMQKLKEAKPKQYENPNFTIRINKMWVQGGASNYYQTSNGKCEIVKPQIAFQTSDWKKQSKPVIDKNIDYCGNEEADKKLANDRAVNFVKYVQKQFPKLSDGNITVKLDPDYPKIRSYIVDTGGELDSNRDKKKYPVPGQFVRAVINFITTRKNIDIDEGGGGTPEDVMKCLQNAEFLIGYNGKGGHSCDFALFNVYANNVKLGVANLNNGSFDTGEKKAHTNTEGKKITDFTESRYRTDNKYGGIRYCKFKLDKKQIQSIASKSKEGKVTISIEGFKSNWYAEKGIYGHEALKCGAGPGQNCSKKPIETHADTPTVVVRLLGRVQYSGKPQVKMERGSIKTDVYTFKPCDIFIEEKKKREQAKK